MSSQAMAMEDEHEASTVVAGEHAHSHGSYAHSHDGQEHEHGPYSHRHDHEHQAHEHVHDEEHSHDGHSHSHDGHSHSHDGHSHSHDGHSHSHDSEALAPGLYEFVDPKKAVESTPKEEEPEEAMEVEVYKGPADRYVTALDATEFDDESEEVRYAGTSGLKVTSMDGLDRVKNLRSLTLRSCLLRDCSAIAANGATLEFLELYDNQLRSLRGVEACPRLRVLDVSFNVIRSTQPVAICRDLEECYVAANKLRSIEGFEKLDKLTKLDLGANRIRSIDGLPPNLKHLFLGKNRIDKIQHLNHLTNLKVLDVQSNRLTSLSGDCFENLANLEELYLAHNAIGPDLEASQLAPLANLSTLDLSHNRLESLTPFAVLKKLEDLWISYNQIQEDLPLALQPITHLPLTCIYLDHNPCAADPRYLPCLRETFPNLNQVDANSYPPLPRSS